MVGDESDKEGATGRPENIMAALKKTQKDAGITLQDFTGITKDPVTGALIAEDLNVPMAERKKLRDAEASQPLRPDSVLGKLFGVGKKKGRS